MAVESLAATYYMRADGQAGSKSSATGCGSSATAMSVGTFQNQRFDPGDRIVLCHEGGVFRTTMYLRDGGVAGSPIIFDGRRTAVFSGSDIIRGWTADGGSIFVANVPTQPQQVFMNGAFGDRKANRGQLLDDRDWYWESNHLYVYSSVGDPDSVFTAPGIEASTRGNCIGFGGQDYVIFEGLTVRHSNFVGFRGWNPGSHVTIKNCVAEWNWEVGIDLNANTIYDSIIIEDTIARNNGTGGIALLGPARNSILRRNSCYGNGKYQSLGNEYSSMFQWTFGIKLWENGASQEGNIVHSNKVFDNGRGQEGDYQGRGVGIWLDGVPGNPGNLNVVRHNLVHSNTGNGIFLEISGNTVVLGNVLYHNASNTGGINEFAPANIAIDARESFVSENNLVYNNTSLGGRYGLKVVTYGCSGCSVDNNIIRNNIIVGAIEHNFVALFGGDNVGPRGFGNRYEFNNFDEERSGFIRWSGTNYATYSSWEAAYGLPAHSVPGDPQFAGSSPTTLYLESDSPCRNSGTNLGPVFDQGLIEDSSWPTAVQVTDQDLYEDSWELGAYCYTGNGSSLIFQTGFEDGTFGSFWSPPP
jgi:parallel beta-helix repeat protein